MQPEDVTFELEPIYKKASIVFKQAKAIAIYLRRLINKFKAVCSD